MGAKNSHPRGSHRLGEIERQGRSGLSQIEAPPGRLAKISDLAVTSSGRIWVPFRVTAPFYPLTCFSEYTAVRPLPLSFSTPLLSNSERACFKRFLGIAMFSESCRRVRCSYLRSWRKIASWSCSIWFSGRSSAPFRTSIQSASWYPPLRLVRMTSFGPHPSF